MTGFVPAKYFSGDKAWKVKTEKTTLELISHFCYQALEANHKLSPAARVPSKPWETSTSLVASQ